MTPSFTQGLGQFVAYVLNDFTHDENPMFKGDSEVAYDNTEQPVVVNQKNYRSPTMVSVTLGEDSGTEATIGWFSKSTVQGDIEIYEAETEPAFTGKATTGATFSVSKTTEPVIRQFPGIDLDIFGLFWYAFKTGSHASLYWRSFCDCGSVMWKKVTFLPPSAVLSEPVRLHQPRFASPTRK